MKKFMLDLQVSGVERIHERYVLLRLTCVERLPEMVPGQFAEVRVDGSPSTFLRRPISIHFVDRRNNELWLLVATVGDGTRRLGQLQVGERVNCVLPLGNGFSIPPRENRGARTADERGEHETDERGERAADERGAQEAAGGARAADKGGAQAGCAEAKLLLVGGGVGVAPLLFLGAELKGLGFEPTFLLGARTGGDLLMVDEFRRYGRVLITTEDGSVGERGFVTRHSVLSTESFDRIYTCGPTPMMKAVAAYAYKNNVFCEASLENMMACGLGACLCCVEKTTEGNLCVCKNGPVFNINQLLWQN